ncbi:putative flap endonuclease 1 [Conidiobolus coronatus NRRL 28638]|uniref:Putative flap endonuclease 1 n=1 Tax=Conidiobolus coronatus (strain ATCC 28846 / CBS 209.66 / NRRL 28638) TaxID=796925 RepID=A0A137P3T9_CONC2|nr:putative flap endonuclease 1 [Conidiobolus coronatus NRRL 28638]|eukprot:KXN69676.1 putative flap endonuclease 1 [Conidiobolus coronatus NRRL 28638]
MGVRGLYELISKNAPRAIKPCNYNMYSGHIIAIDASIQIYKCLHNITRYEYDNFNLLSGKVSSHIRGLFSITYNMVNMGIKPLYVFDGKPPILKSIVLNKRDEQKKNNLSILENMIKAADNQTSIEIENKLKQVTEVFGNKAKEESNPADRLAKNEAKRFIELVQQIVGTPMESDIKREEFSSHVSQDEVDIPTNLTYDEAKIAKKSIKMSYKHINECKKLLDLMGIPYIEAPSEAEAQCAALCRAGVVSAAASDDLDTLAFSSPTLLRNFIGWGSNEIVASRISLKEVLKQLDINQKSFVDLCILMGCDYCDVIQGIGPGKALHLIKRYGNIETIVKNLDVEGYALPDNFSYKEARELFLRPNVKEVNQSDFKWTKPNEEGLIKFLVKENGCEKDKVLIGVKKLENGLKYNGKSLYRL